MADIAPAGLLLYRQQLRQFVTFTDAEWDLFTGYLYPRTLKKKELFVRSGSICREIGFITTGSVRFFFLKDGLEISSYFCFEQELITSYGSFLKGTPSPISIEAQEDTEVLCFTHEALQEMLADLRLAYKMERFGRLIAEYLICCYEDRLFSFLALSPEQRYEQLLQQQPDLLQRIPQHQIANFLGITAVSLSRIRKRILSKRVPCVPPVSA